MFWCQSHLSTGSLGNLPRNHCQKVKKKMKENFHRVSDRLQECTEWFRYITWGSMQDKNNITFLINFIVNFMFQFSMDMSFIYRMVCEWHKTYFHTILLYQSHKQSNFITHLMDLYWYPSSLERKMFEQSFHSLHWYHQFQSLWSSNLLLRSAYPEAVNIINFFVGNLIKIQI